MAIQHVYQNPGIYVITLTTKDSQDRESTVTRQVIVEPSTAPVPLIRRSARRGPAPLEVVFDGSETVVPSIGEGPTITVSEWRWDFGDGVTGTETPSTGYEPIPTTIPPGPPGPAGATGPAGTDSTVAGPTGGIGPTGPAGQGIDTAFSGLAKITVGSITPTNANIGDLWIDTN